MASAAVIARQKPPTPQTSPGSQSLFWLQLFAARPLVVLCGGGVLGGAMVSACCASARSGRTAKLATTSSSAETLRATEAERCNRIPERTEVTRSTPRWCIRTSSESKEEGGHRDARRGTGPAPRTHRGSSRYGRLSPPIGVAQIDGSVPTDAACVEPSRSTAARRGTTTLGAGQAPTDVTFAKAAKYKWTRWLVGKRSIAARCSDVAGNSPNV